MPAHPHAHSSPSPRRVHAADAPLSPPRHLACGRLRPRRIRSTDRHYVRWQDWHMLARARTRARTLPRARSCVRALSRTAHVHQLRRAAIPARGPNLPPAGSSCVQAARRRRRGVKLGPGPRQSTTIPHHTQQPSSPARRSEAASQAWGASARHASMRAGRATPRQVVAAGRAARGDLGMHVSSSASTSLLRDESRTMLAQGPART